MNNAATLLNILQALTYVFIYGYQHVTVDEIAAEDVSATREAWGDFLSNPKGSEYVLVRHDDLHTYRLVVQ